MRTSSILLASVVFGLSAVSADGHHSAAPIFDTDKLVVVEGVVTEVWFENPHSRYYIQVTSQDGEGVLWEAETMNANWFLRRGWDETTVQTGDQVTLNGYLARNGSNVFLLRHLTRADETLYRWTRLDGANIALDQIVVGDAVSYEIIAHHELPEEERCIIVFDECTN